MPLRVVLADDHTLVRAGIRALLEALGGVTVVGEAGTGHEVLDLVAQHAPDLVLLDIGMPGLSGLEVAQRLSKGHPRVRVVILSMHKDETYVVQALRAGVAGYLLKDAATTELPMLLESVRRGDAYLSPGVARRVADLLRRNGHAGRGPLDALTPRQREVLQLIAEGRSVKEIAAALSLSIKTVETHRAQLMERLDIRDVPGLVRLAVRAGLVSADH